MQMPASHPILPDDRKHREIATRQASRQRRVSDEWTLVEFRPARWLVAALTVLCALARYAHSSASERSSLWLGDSLLDGSGSSREASRHVALVVLAGSVAALVLVLDQLA